MKRWAIIAFFVVAFLLQTTLLNLIAIVGITPNLFLCLTVILMRLTEDHAWVVGTAAITAVVYDICFSEQIGVTVAAMLIAGVFLYAADRRFRLHHLLPVLILTVAVTFVYDLILLGARILLGYHDHFFYVMGQTALYSLYNMAAVGALYFIFVKAGEEDR